jgi:hypothetical protein
MFAFVALRHKKNSRYSRSSRSLSPSSQYDTKTSCYGSSLPPPHNGPRFLLPPQIPTGATQNLKPYHPRNFLRLQRMSLHAMYDDYDINHTHVDHGDIMIGYHNINKSSTATRELQSTTSASLLVSTTLPLWLREGKRRHHKDTPMTTTKRRGWKRETSNPIAIVRLDFGID